MGSWRRRGSDRRNGHATSPITKLKRASTRSSAPSSSHYIPGYDIILLGMGVPDIAANNEESGPKVRCLLQYNSLTTNATLQEKTKAKKRYLKAKKERRKKRKSAGATTSIKSATKLKDVVESVEAVSGSSSEDDEEEEVVEVTPPAKKKEKKPNLPRLLKNRLNKLIDVKDER